MTKRWEEFETAQYWNFMQTKSLLTFNLSNYLIQVKLLEIEGENFQEKLSSD